MFVRLRMRAGSAIRRVACRVEGVQGACTPPGATLSAPAQVPPSLGRKSALSSVDPGGATTFLSHVSSQLRELACGRFYCGEFEFRNGDFLLRFFLQREM